MRAGIIAAGEGSRLRAEGVDVPKPLVKVDGVPLIERLLTIFVRQGITDVVCIVNEWSLDVKRYVESRDYGIPVRFVVKTTPSSMHSLFALAPHLGGEQFLLSTVDPIFDEREFSGYLGAARERSSADGLLAVTKYVDDENPLYVELDSKGGIVKFSKAEQTPWVTGGLYVFSPRIFDEVDAALAAGVERLRNFLGHLVRAGYALEGYPFSTIIDVDHVQDIRVAEALLRAHA
jgi:NDP-sugar pyrophosphorylase family protein